ncbi:OprO/OprP family phosphate-selective porin [Myxococcota bacterium]|nr:OprO/OprP family phosphate-selective porin [Myxococcota bacterium]
MSRRSARSALLAALLTAGLPARALAEGDGGTTPAAAETGLKLPEGLTLRPVVQAQIWATPFDQDDAEGNDPIVVGDPDHKEGVTVRRARLGIRAWYKGLLGVSVVGGWDDRYDALEARPEIPGISEAYVAFAPAREVQVQAGVTRVPFGRQATASSFALALWERAMASERMAPPREPGLVVGGAVGKAVGSVLPEGALRYAVGVFNGGGDWTGDADPGPRVAGRVSVDLLAPWDARESNFALPKAAISIGGAANHAWELEADTLTVQGDLGVRFWRFSLQGEAFWSRAVPTFDTEGIPELLTERESFGWYGQLGFMLVPGRLEVAARVDGYDDNTAIEDAGDRLDVAGGVNVFLWEGRVGLQLDYVHRVELAASAETPNDSVILVARASL